MITEDQREAYERGIADLNRKAAKFATSKPWIAAAHLHSADVMKSILDKNPRREPEPEYVGTEEAR